MHCASALFEVLLVLKEKYAAENWWIAVESGLVQRLGDKSISKKELLQRLEQNSALLLEVLKGTSSPKAGIRYGCGKVLMDYQ